MLLKLCATGTLLLQAFQGKGAVKRLDISSFMRMGLYETDKKEGKSHTFYVIKAKIFGDLWRKCIAGAWVQLWYCRCLSTRQRTSEQRRLCSLALLTSSIPLSHRRERLDWFDNMFISSVVCMLLSLWFWFWTQTYEGGDDCTQEVHCTTEEGEGGVWQLHAAGNRLVLDHKREAKTKTDLIV